MLNEWRKKNHNAQEWQKITNIIYVPHDDYDIFLCCDAVGGIFLNINLLHSSLSKMDFVVVVVILQKYLLQMTTKTIWLLLILFSLIFIYKLENTERWFMTCDAIIWLFERLANSFWSSIATISDLMTICQIFFSSIFAFFFKEKKNMHAICVKHTILLRLWHFVRWWPHLKWTE